jgi:CheY-like chemotaxis protein
MVKPSESARALPPDTFVAQTQSALGHIHDFVYLQGHPLARHFQSAAEKTREPAGQFLRRAVIEAVESLNPGTQVSFRSPHARLYNLLYLHYVEGMTVQQVADELTISLRQAFRDLRHAEEAVAAILWARVPGTPGTSDELEYNSALRAEIDRLEVTAASVDLRELLERAGQAVQRLAQVNGVELEWSIPPDPVMVSAEPEVALQLLVGVLSHTVQDVQAAKVRVELSADKRQALVVLRYRARTQPRYAKGPDSATLQFANRLGWTLEQAVEPAETKALAIRVPVGRSTVLVIDDNEGLIQLFERFLAGQACRVIQATNGPEGLRLAQQVSPDAIVLDVMMPKVDGWRVLQTLKTQPPTASIPVIVCSVIKDTRLAASLGAAYYLPKPVGRDDALATFRALGLI